MEAYIKEAAYFVALIAESVAIAIIFLGVVKTVIFYLKNSLPFTFKPELISSMRVRLGSSLSLSLEFLIGADILKTAISPNWNEIGMLGAIVVIRTVLNYFLTEELRPDFESTTNS
ncbi:MAG: DUF1622 domain-containing protein [Chlamydiales bacterium]|nr:DUF1622 domain-containing protein [Chlamydiia bacterium]MCP5508210.1 DUF1622 domain-containing protein [Chlamydiales bacterium]